MGMDIAFDRDCWLANIGATRRGQYRREAGEKGEANAGIDQIGRARDEQFATP
jgi:hypothetical protein